MLLENVVYCWKQHSLNEKILAFEKVRLKDFLLNISDYCPCFLRSGIIEQLHFKTFS